QVCHSLLDRSWIPNTTVSQILSCVYGLLMYPDHDDPLDSTLALQMYASSEEYKADIVKHVSIHASKPRAVWNTELEAEGMPSTDRQVAGELALTTAQAALRAGHIDLVS
ncbi:unnamed protein product, partial [Sphacelaria rigidula]